MQFDKIMTKSLRPPNHLAREKSPYLLQHQYNPVDWHPWGNEAFEKARTENKPIFLSIGYATCHWCHVMERESFENPEVAAFLNVHFVSIKVDREERPDVDKIYMTAIQALTGQGGWPLSAFLTPDLQPFFGGTYFPPENRYHRPSFMSVLKQLHQVWEERRGDVLQTGREIQGQLTTYLRQRAPESAQPSPALLQQAGTIFKQDYDSTHGGFGRAPKFPQPSIPAFLLRYGVRFNDLEAVRMVLYTCERMAAGGIHDQLGGGFARYSVDQEWLVPHFEKMLYDNAQLLDLYLDAYLISNEPKFATVARGIVAYLLRDMTHPDGGFFSAEDADSEGKEGKFYCWTHAEIATLLSPEEFNVAVKYYGVTEEGNFVDHSDPQPLPNQNVLSVADANVDTADHPLLASAKEKLFTARSRRVRPFLDDKVLASWNGLMLGALARAAIVLHEPTWLAAAEKNAAFIRKYLWDEPNRTLHHRWRDGERDEVQLLSAYASQLSGHLGLYEATLQPRHLEFAIQLADGLLKRFHDAEAGGFWQSTGAGELIVRVKEDYDGAEPSGNSVAALALLKLGEITGNPTYTQAAEGTLRLFAERLQRLPQAVPHLLLALDYSLEEPRRIVFAGIGGEVLAEPLFLAAHKVYQPNKVILGTGKPVETFAQGLKSLDGKPTAYVCTGTACQPPTHVPEQLVKLLRQA
ncbi:MAG: thioredoxin domain-containing protein [Verrucomicrobiota bacterium]